MAKKFQKTQEDFVCDHCGQKNVGNGYTNHCAFCLWSKHVDINPGDRASSCEGMLVPIDAYFKNQTWRIVHQCSRCEIQKEIKSAKNDSWAALEKLVAEKSRKMMG